MTVPPNGPYGQDPYGQQNPYGTNPYGQQPYGQQPYGQQPYWGEQPQGQPPAQPESPYPYQPGAQYGPGPGDPYAYPPQQYPQGGYPSGPPPGGSSSKTPWLIVGGIAVLGVLVLVVILVVSLNSGDSPKAAPSSTSASAPTSAPANTEQTATECSGNVSGGPKPTDETVAAGNLSFPASAAPGWAPFTDDQNPNLIQAVGLAQEVPGGSQWMMQVEVAVTNFVTSMDVATQASKLLDCVANGPGYIQASPSLGPKKTSSTTVDGVKAARVEADINIADVARGVKGDTVTIIAVETKPVTIFMGAVPIGDAASQGIVNQVIAALKAKK